MILYTLICIFFTYLNCNYINADANLRIAFLPFAKLTNQFLATIQPNNALNNTKIYINQFLYNSSIPFSGNNYQDFINQVWQPYVGYIILVIIGVIFMTIFTLVGCCFCCCRCCCHKCGAKAPGSSQGNTKSRRILLNMFLLIFVILITIGGIIAMASNAILLETVKSPSNTDDKTGNMLSNLDTTLTYAASFTSYVANNGLNNGVPLLKNTLQSLASILSSAITLFTNTFFNALNIGSIINNTNTIIKGYTNLVTQAQILSNISSLHKNMTADFNQYLQMVVQNLTILFNSTACRNLSDSCNAYSPLLQYVIIGYNSTNINYTMDIGAPSVFSGYNISTLTDAQAQFNNSTQNMTRDINSTLTGYIQSFTDNFNSSSGIFQSYNSTFDFQNTVVNTLNSFNKTLYSLILPNNLSVEKDGLYALFIYVFYGFIVIIGIIFITVLFFCVGLLFGICGGPNFEDSSCCSKGAGSRFLMGGIGMAYVFGWLIMLIVTLMFIGGGLMSTEGCRYLSNTSSTDTLSTLDEIINSVLASKNITIPLNNVKLGIPNVNIIQSLLIRCPASTDLISAFQIPPAYLSAISSSIYQQWVLPQLLNVVQKINNYTIPSISASSIKNNTDQIANIITQLNAINSGPTIVELSKPVLQIDLQLFLVTISNFAQAALPTWPDFANGLNSSVSQLNSMTTAMAAVQTSYLTQKNVFTTMASGMTVPLISVSNSISILSSQANDAKISAVAVTNSSLGQNTSRLVNQTLFNVVLSLGNCQGLSTAFNSGVAILCTTFLVPFNNLWMGIGWFLLFIIPAMAIALKLSKLYRISHIETYASSYNKAYQSSNNFLSPNDMQMIKMDRPAKV